MNKNTIIFLILLISLLIIGCSEGFKANVEKYQEPLVGMSEDCEEWALSNIPKEIELHWDNGYREWRQEDSKLMYYKGNNQGQNINYYYAKFQTFYYNPDQEEPISQQYSKIVTDDEGNILGSNSFKARFTLKMTENGERLDNSKCYHNEINELCTQKYQLFEIMDIEFISCNYIK